VKLHHRWGHPFALEWRAVHLEAIERVGRALWRRADDKRIVGLASESAFWVSLALIPLAAVSGMVVARFAVSDRLVAEMLSRSLPAEAEQMVARELSTVASYDGGRLGPLATVVFVWLASSGVHAILDAFEALAGVAARPWWKKRAISVAACFAGALGVGAIALLGAPFAQFAHADGAEPASPEPWSTATRLVLGVATDLLLTAGLYWVALPRAARPHVMLPGVCVAVGLQFLLGACYSLILGTLGDGSAYLAGLAVVGVTMTVVFIYMLSLLAGLALNLALSAHLEAPRGPARGRVKSL
jgi:membrane protein